MPLRLEAHGKSVVEVTFLGDGFLHLAIDLNLVMKGKPAAVRKGADVQTLECCGIYRSDEARRQAREEMSSRRRNSSLRETYGSTHGWY